MMRVASQRPANTQVILQRLAEIDRIVNPPPLLRKSGSEGNSAQASVKKAGFFGGKADKSLSSSRKTPLVRIADWFSNSPQPGDIKLQSFNFEVVTVDSQGKENSRNLCQANFFTEDLGKGILLEMVAIPGGTFMMGSPDREKRRVAEEIPQHSVTVKPFYLGKFTITQAQWKAVAALRKVSRSLNADPSNFKGDNLPVERVSWFDAQEFCARLSRKTGRTYRLPSEAQWEYACRAGTTTPFHFGETINTDLANYHNDYTYGSGLRGEDRRKTTPVGSFQVANAFGLYDMHGNVWEWCEDHWHNNYYGAPKDGSAWLKDDQNNPCRIVRGGSWFYNPWDCRSTFRHGDAPFFKDKGIGFRVVCLRNEVLGVRC
ncbi:MAG: formylglycine-generating enzyme family protein [Symploca sp. SIO2E6]|nr:formylglycine-generating enzyme family protein [Symploca sp. SIO2E6]